VVSLFWGFPLDIIEEPHHFDGIKTTYDGSKYGLMYGSIDFKGAMTDENGLTAN